MPNLDLLSIDPDQLFEQYTISEIIEINKKIQQELDKKRNELRFMVGERYRDVITAADTIKSMQKYSELLVTKVDNINQKCHETHTSLDVEPAKSTPVDKSVLFYRSIAIQIKILILIPEHIWSCLDVGNYLKASQLYLLAIHMHMGLELDTEHQITQHFALLSRLRLSINLFRNRIVDGIKKHLQFVKLPPKEASSHLSAYMLLENQSLQDVLQTLITLRDSALVELLKADISQCNTVRTQTMSLLNCLVCTIQLIHSSFIGEDNSDDLITSYLQRACAKDAAGTIKIIELEPTPLLEYLPAIVSDFRPACDYDASDIKAIVKDVVQQWMRRTEGTLKVNLSKSLDLVVSVKALHAIREESLKLEMPDNWGQICSDLSLPADFSVWYSLFQPLVSARAEKLVSRKVEVNLNSLCDKINRDLKSACSEECSERDLRWYVWTESPLDLSKDSNDHKGLAMKTRGYSERIVGLCDDLNAKSLELLQDVSLYLYGMENLDVDAREALQAEQQDERLELEAHLSEESSGSIDRMLAYIQNLLAKESDGEMRLTKTIASARFLQAVTQLCPHLIKCCSRGGAQHNWTVVSTKLTDHSLQLWQYWQNHMQATIKELVQKHLCDTDERNFIKILPRWDTIDIEEQTDDQTIKSQISIPLQATISLVVLLSKICSQLNAVIPHTLPRPIHLAFTENMTEAILGHYDKISLADINQTMALQFLLDVKFLSLICIRRDNKKLMNLSQEICYRLRSKVDPFDLDVFYPHLQKNIKRSVLQSQALFGCLMPCAEQLASLGVLETNLSDREPSIMATTVLSNETWFPLLPVTTPIIKSLNLQPAASPVAAIPKQSPLQKLNTEASSASMRSGTVQSFFGAMTNDWFS